MIRRAVFTAPMKIGFVRCRFSFSKSNDGSPWARALCQFRVVTIASMNPRRAEDPLYFARALFHLRPRTP